MRILAQYLRLSGQTYRRAVMEIPDDGSYPAMITAEGEIHSTIFFNGIILLTNPDTIVPDAVKAAEALSYISSIPEPSSKSSYKIVKISFKP